MAQNVVLQSKWIYRGYTYDGRVTQLVDFSEPTPLCIDQFRTYAVFSQTQLVVALDNSNGTILWKTHLDSSVESALVLFGDMLITGDLSGNIHFYNKYTGKQESFLALNIPILKPFTLTSDGSLIVIADDATVFKISLSEKKILWKYEDSTALIPEQKIITTTTAIVIDGLVILTDSNGRIFKLDFDTGELKLEHATIDQHISSLSAIHGITHNNNALWLSTLSGLKQFDLNSHTFWTFKKDWIGLSNVFFHNDYLWLATTTGKIFTIHPESFISNEIVTIPHDGGGTLTFWKGFVVFTSFEGDMYLINEKNAKIVATFAIGSGSQTRPVVMDNDLFLFTNGGNIIRIKQSAFKTSDKRYYVNFLPGS